MKFQISKSIGWKACCETNDYPYLIFNILQYFPTPFLLLESKLQQRRLILKIRRTQFYNFLNANIFANLRRKSQHRPHTSNLSFPQYEKRKIRNSFSNYSDEYFIWDIFIVKLEYIDLLSLHFHLNIISNMWNAIWLLCVLIQIMMVTKSQSQSISVQQSVMFVPNLPSDYSITAQMINQISQSERLAKDKKPKSPSSQKPELVSPAAPLQQPSPQLQPEPQPVVTEQQKKIAQTLRNLPINKEISENKKSLISASNWQFQFQQYHQIQIAKSKTYTLYNIDETKVITDQGSVKQVELKATPSKTPFNQMNDKAQKPETTKTGQQKLPWPELLPKPNIAVNNRPFQEALNQPHPKKDNLPFIPTPPSPSPSIPNVPNVPNIAKAEPQIEIKRQPQRNPQPAPQVVENKKKQEKSPSLQSQDAVSVDSGADYKIHFFIFFSIAAILILVGYTPEQVTIAKPYNPRSDEEQHSNLN